MLNRNNNAEWDEDTYLSLKAMLCSKSVDDIVLASDIIVKANYNINEIWISMLWYEYSSVIVLNCTNINDVLPISKIQYSHLNIYSKFPQHKSLIKKYLL